MIIVEPVIAAALASGLLHGGFSAVRASFAGDKPCQVDPVTFVCER